MTQISASCIKSHLIQKLASIRRQQNTFAETNHPFSYWYCLSLSFLFLFLFFIYFLFTFACLMSFKSIYFSTPLGDKMMLRGKNVWLTWHCRLSIVGRQSEKRYWEWQQPCSQQQGHNYTGQRPFSLTQCAESWDLLLEQQTELALKKATVRQRKG